MEFAEIRTLEDAKAFIRARNEVAHEEMHMLRRMFGADAYRELTALVEELGTQLVGDKGR